MNDLTALPRWITKSERGFVVVGGFAATTHGSSSYVTTPENVDRSPAALADLDPRHRLTPQRLSFLSHPAVNTPVSNLYLETRYGVVDVLTSVLGVGDFERLKRQAEELEVDGVRFRVMSLPDLIAAKEALGREKDLLTAKELRAIAAKRNAT